MIEALTLTNVVARNCTTQNALFFTSSNFQTVHVFRVFMRKRPCGSTGALAGRFYQIFFFTRCPWSNSLWNNTSVNVTSSLQYHILNYFVSEELILFGIRSNSSNLTYLKKKLKTGHSIPRYQPAIKLCGARTPGELDRRIIPRALYFRGQFNTNFYKCSCCDELIISPITFLFTQQGHLCGGNYDASCIRQV